MSQLPHQFEFALVRSQPPRVKDSIAGRVGMVTGASEPYENGQRDYAVHFNDLGECYCVPEQYLEFSGRIGRREDIRTRSRLHARLQER